jgi:hypothetical protein
MGFVLQRSEILSKCPLGMSHESWLGAPVWPKPLSPQQYTSLVAVKAQETPLATATFRGVPGRTTFTGSPVAEASCLVPSPS